MVHYDSSGDPCDCSMCTAEKSCMVILVGEGEGEGTERGREREWGGRGKGGGGRGRGIENHRMVQ